MLYSAMLALTELMPAQNGGMHRLMPATALLFALVLAVVLQRLDAHVTLLNYSAYLFQLL